MPLVPQSVSAVIEALGPLGSDVSAVIAHAEDAWVVSFLDDTQAVLRWCNTPERLQTSTQVAQFEQALSAEMLEVLLAFNLLSDQTQGARMAWEPRDRTLHLVRDLPQAECRTDTLLESLRSLVGTADYWREALMDEAQIASVKQTSPQ